MTIASNDLDLIKRELTGIRDTIRGSTPKFHRSKRSWTGYPASLQKYKNSGATAKNAPCYDATAGENGLGSRTENTSVWTTWTWPVYAAC